MGSHYIPVNSLKLDGVSIQPEVYCPANGYPDPNAPDFPETLQNYPEALGAACVIAGYTPPEPDGTYEPPIDIGTPAAQQILLLCTNNYPGVIYFRVNGNYTVEIWDETQTNLIQTSDHASAAYYTYYFPTAVPDTYYIVKIKGRGANLTVFRCYDITNAGFSGNWQILEAKFNTPNITTLSYAFQNIKTIKRVIFESTLDSLTTLEYFFNNSGIEKFIFPASLPALTTAQFMFADSSLRTLDMNNCNMPNCTSIVSFAARAYWLINLTFNAIIPQMSNMTSAFQYIAVKNLIIDSTIGEYGQVLTVSNLCNGNAELEYFTSWIGHDNSNSANIGSAIIANTPKLKKITWRGSIMITTVGCIQSSNALEEIVGGTKHYASGGNVLTCDNAPVKKVTMPSILLAGTGYFSANTSAYYQLEEIIGGDTVTGNALWLSTGFINSARKLKIINFPNIAFQRLTVGINGGSLEYIEIDWENSNFATYSVAIYGNLSTSEINRIFTALPAFNQTIDVRYNPGYAACNKSIATAKGWTVL